MPRSSQGSNRVGFDSVVFADSASLAALSCFARLTAARDAGRRTLIIPLVDRDAAEAITARGLAEVRALPDAATEAAPQREWIAAQIRRHAPRHVLAPLGLLGAPRAIDYFTTLRAAMNVDPGRDLLFFEERPCVLVPEALSLRLSALGVRLPPATQLQSPRGRLSFSIRLVLGLTPPIFGALSERLRLSRSLKTAFREASDWDPQRALGPKLQPVTEPWTDSDTAGIFDLAGAIGETSGLGNIKTFTNRMTRHAATARSRTPIERYWLSLPGAQEPDPVTDTY